MNYRGDVIEESLRNKAVLSELHIVSTRLEQVTPRHKTPWLKRWTLHTIEVSEAEANAVAEELSRSLDGNHWYVDFKNEVTHYIIFQTAFSR